MKITNHLFNLITGIVAAAAIILAAIAGCTSKKSEIDEEISDEAFRNDDLVAEVGANGTISFRNTVTGAVTIKDIKLDWTQPSRHDSLAVFCSEGKRGYYNMYTGEIAVKPQYRRAWVFSEGLAAVQRNGNIGFIDHKGNVVIDFLFPYHGNPLSDFVFDDGHCVVANAEGKCGVIDKTGKWLIQPEYDNVDAFREYAIASKAGVTLQVTYDGRVLNSFVLDSVYQLSYEEEERFENREGEIQYVDKSIQTGLFAYYVGGRCGLMDANCHRLTEPVYSSIRAVNRNMFRATLLDGWSEVILNAKGEVMR